MKKPWVPSSSCRRSSLTGTNFAVNLEPNSSKAFVHKHPLHYSSKFALFCLLQGKERSIATAYFGMLGFVFASIEEAIVHSFFSLLMIQNDGCRLSLFGGFKWQFGVG